MSPLDLVRAKRIVLAAGKHDLPTVADLVAGEPVRGNWWSHPKGGDIFRVLNDLDDHEEVRTCRLVGGRVTFVHASLWPAVIRLAGDVSRVKETLRGLPAVAKRLHQATVLAGAEGLRTDRAPRLKGGRRPLELALLVQTDEVHTESGKHAAVLKAWDHVGTARERRAAAAMSLEEAVDAIVEALLGAAQGATVGDVRRWIPVDRSAIALSAERISARSGR